MFKKHLILALLLVMAAITANADTWKMHSIYLSSYIDNVFDAGDKVYYLNNGCLFEFDKTTTNTTALSRQNKLSDNVISQIYYDYENRLLFVAYANSNIDVINAEGQVFNISCIKDMIPQAHNVSFDFESSDAHYDFVSDYTTKTINDITFANGIAYVTIGYGYLTIDESTMEVTYGVELGQKININSVSVIDDMMLIFSNGYCYYGELGETDPIHNFEKRSGTYTGYKSFPINDHKVFVLGTSKLYTLDFSTETPTLTTLVSAAPTCVQRTPNGFIANFKGQSYYYTIDPEGTTATKASSTAGFATSDPLGDGTVWINDANGIHVKGSTTYYKKNSLNISVPYWLKYNAHDGLLYVASSGPNVICVNTLYTNVVNTYDGNTWNVVTPYTNSGSVGYEFVFNPLDSTTYFRASWNKGIFKVTNNERKLTYNSTNSPLGTYKAHPAFDKQGNMWVVSSYGNASCPVAVLPKDKVANNTVTMTDWFQPSGLLSLNTGSMQRSRFVISRKNNVKMYSDCDVPNISNKNGFIMCWDNNNEDPTVDNYHLAAIDHFVDQHNKQVDWIYINHMEQDNDGIIWVGHTAGIFSFDPDEVFNDMPKAKRFPLEGSYLCEGYSVYDIGCDRDNNKWIATNNGVYYVSADGSKLFQHFTSTNSDLPSDVVYSIECDTVKNRVYIYSTGGFAEYVATGSKAALNFDGLYAHPNPVEPDYTGMVAIDGLMENSYVTITDREGNVVAQFGPVTGQALWDTSGADGERVPTGIYHIYAAQGEQPAITGTPRNTVMIIK